MLGILKFAGLAAVLTAVVRENYSTRSTPDLPALARKTRRVRLGNRRKRRMT
jgi:hypothetical protein